MSDSMNREYTAGNGNGHPSPGPAHSREEDASIGGLLKQLGREVPSLVTKELALVKAEFAESMRATKAGVAAVSAGGAVIMAGLIIVLLAFVYALSNVLAPWLSALIVGAGAMIIGFIMVQSGKKKFESESLKPERTINTLHKDKNAIGGRIS